MATKEKTYEMECGEDDTPFTFVYEIEPYDPGYRYDKNGDGLPPSGGYATIYEVRRADKSILPESDYAAHGIDIEKIAEKIWESVNQPDDDYPDYDPPDYPSREVGDE